MRLLLSIMDKIDDAEGDWQTNVQIEIAAATFNDLSPAKFSDARRGVQETLQARSDYMQGIGKHKWSVYNLLRNGPDEVVITGLLQIGERDVLFNVRFDSETMMCELPDLIEESLADQVDWTTDKLKKN